MQLFIQGVLKNVFKAKDFTNESGEVSKGKWQLQFEDKIKVEDGYQLVIHKVSVPDEKIGEYKSFVGKEITIPVRAFASKGKIIYYGV